MRCFVQGGVAVAEAAFRAGCRFFAGYPISPANDIATRMAELLEDEGTFIQMEDEIASICAALGASWSGAKAMTATSGPGLSLMQEAVGYAYFTETPVVIVDVQRAGPATGQATRVGQGDVMQLRYGSHGDVYPIALVPWSVQELYDLTVRAFNLAERFRVPVYVATDEAVASTFEVVELHRNFDVLTRVRKRGAPPFGSGLPDGVPPMPAFGDGEQLLVTGSTHDEWGRRRTRDPEAHEKLVTRLMRKTMDHERELAETEACYLEDADVAFFAYGTSARSAFAAVRMLRARGRRVGMLRPRTLWPFPEERVRALGEQVARIVVPECNTGMIADIVRGLSAASVHAFTRTNGDPIAPEALIELVEGLL
jgi:2-oxoglutarate/2-oxoacid ferredoxin oxidoreductase subunit alpha